ncbi:MAG: FAD-dependent oxidoreductase, partial [Kiritimatiellae bacterium]|nr:FAD-dependent oxidoreductase [Kiritimatiellia bacterium]
IQTALDLADTGQKVYLLESSPSIGGNMARLDKTFPTNDCSMCILSPKVVECGRHLNIEVITWSRLEAVDGSAGDFTVRIRRRARYVDSSKCTGCGECVSVCPVEHPNEFDAGLGPRKAIFRPCPQAYPNVFVVDKQGYAPCRAGCPAGININAYVALTAKGKFDEALRVVLETVPMPGVLGRVCEHPCETYCARSTAGEPVAICAIKRFLADRARISRPFRDRPPQRLEPIAIIGSGPAGLAAARELARMGYRPTVFEASSRPGGMLAWAIPEYRLPRDVLEEEIRDILDEGVALKTNTRLGREITIRGLREEGFAAVVLAIGAQGGTKLGIPNENVEGVQDSLAFLRQVNSGTPPSVGQRVLVVGGGNSAMDAARTALRLGAKKVTVVYRRTRAEMPAIAEEVCAAEAEGVELVFLAAPLEVITGENGHARQVRCIRMCLGAPDTSGRRTPIPISGSEFTLPADTIIYAVGQKVLLPEDPDLADLKTRRDGTIVVNPADCSTTIAGIFAIGDAATGPRNVIEAIASGRRVALAVDCYLRGKPSPASLPGNRNFPDALWEKISSASGHAREKPSELTPDMRKKDFAEVVKGLTEDQVLKEADRCLRCAVCSECQLCNTACKAGAIVHMQEDSVEDIKVGAIVMTPGFEEYSARPLLHELGYHRYADVITSMEFERMLSASGPFGGHIRRPSDGREPGTIAFLQCVGSRDLACRNAYCSSVCCMYAIKQAVIAREHCPGLEATIFFMDVRAFGKDFDKYAERARREYGVRFLRSRVGEVVRLDGHISVRFSEESGVPTAREFDLVVLSVGLAPSPSHKDLARKLRLRLTRHGFVWTEPLNPVATSRPGVFVAGPASEPKDIPETVTQASAAACEVSRLLSDARYSLTRERQFPPERDVTTTPLRIGVFICQCGINIGGIVNVPELVQYAKLLPHVVYAEDNLYTCSQDTQTRIRDIILQKEINRVVVASCSPRTHEALFQQTLREAGLNPHLFVMANIRDQCSWPHMREPRTAT